MRLGNPGIAIDSTAEENGKWIDCPREWGDSVKILVRGTDTPSYRRLARSKKLDTLDDESRLRAVSEMVGEYLIAGWTGLVDAAGAEIPYSREMAAAICADRDNRRFVDYVLGKALSRDTFDVAQAGEDAKN